MTDQIVPDSEHRGLIERLPQAPRDLAQLARFDRPYCCARNLAVEIGVDDVVVHAARPAHRHRTQQQPQQELELPPCPGQPQRERTGPEQ